MGANDSPKIGIDGSVDTGGGHIAGRDVFNIALNIIEKKLPPNDPLPQEFEKALEKLKILIATLRSWKEVHNSLDEIRSRFDQYKRPIDSANYKKQLIAHKNIKLYWRPVMSKSDIFKNRIQEAIKVEKEFSLSTVQFYEEREDDVMECRKKSFLLIDISRDLDLHLEDIANSQNPLATNYGYLFQNVKMKIGLENHWWHHLSNLTDELDNNITESMYLSDKLLRNSADYLYEFSQTVFGVKGK